MKRYIVILKPRNRKYWIIGANGKKVGGKVK